MATEVANRTIPTDDMPTELDIRVAKGLAALANRTTRRGFLAVVGRGAVALLGAGYLGIWRSESAWAACGSRHDYSTRFSCMCSGLIGSNTCPQCCGGFWVACPRSSNPAGCCVKCDGTRTGWSCKYVHLYDCCNTCSSGCKKEVKCGRETKATCCYGGYCSDGCRGKKVRCVRKVCTQTVCASGTCPV